jgi:hypothetical protein
MPALRNDGTKRAVHRGTSVAEHLESADMPVQALALDSSTARTSTPPGQLFRCV